MKKRILAILFSLLWAVLLNAQVMTKAKIENVNANIVGDKIEVIFIITNTSIDEKLTVELRFEVGDRNVVPKTLSGSTEKLEAGNHKLVWDVLKDVDELKGEIIPVIKIIASTAQLKPQHAFIPGFKGRSQLLATVSYGCILTGAYQYYNYHSKYNKYKDELNDPDLRQSYYDKAASAKTISAILIGTGVGLLATNFILSKLYNKKYNFASISYHNGGLFFTYQHTINFKR
jgi:hypothetical protein